MSPNHLIWWNERDRGEKVLMTQYILVQITRIMQEQLQLSS